MPGSVSPALLLRRSGPPLFIPVSLTHGGNQFVESHYDVGMNAAAASQLNRAIAHGAEKGMFVLPKGRPCAYDILFYLTLALGSSGKVKLAERSQNGATKEVGSHLENFRPIN